MADAESDKSDGYRVVSGRGPGYPFISLRKAVERAESIRDANMTRAAAKPMAFYKIWGYAGESGGARQTMAALNHFGLLDYVGRGDAREVRLSDLARRIVLDKVPNSKDRMTALREAALAPVIHKKLFEAYPPPLPPDVVIETFLTRDNDFNDQAAASVMTEWRDTLEYSGLDKPDNIPEYGIPGDQKPLSIAKIGDLVQWTSNGVDQFSTPKRVVGIQTHEGREWAFLDNEVTGVPIAELTIVAATPVANSLPPTVERPLLTAMMDRARKLDAPNLRQEIFALEEGDVTLTFPDGLSLESYADLESYISIFLRKAKRRAELSAASATATDWRDMQSAPRDRTILMRGKLVLTDDAKIQIFEGRYEDPIGWVTGPNNMMRPAYPQEWKPK